MTLLNARIKLSALRCALVCRWYVAFSEANQAEESYNSPSLKVERHARRPSHVHYTSKCPPYLPEAMRFSLGLNTFAPQCGTFVFRVALLALCRPKSSFSFRGETESHGVRVQHEYRKDARERMGVPSIISLTFDRTGVRYPRLCAISPIPVR